MLLKCCGYGRTTNDGGRSPISYCSSFLCLPPIVSRAPMAGESQGEVGKKGYSMNNSFLRLITVCCTFTLSACALHSDVEQSATPSATFIDVVGEVEAGIIFKLKVGYRTTIQTSACTDYSLGLGRRVGRTLSYDYYPKMSGTSHQTHLPLQQVSPNTECGWQPSGVSICSGAKGEAPTRCSSVFAFNGKQRSSTAPAIVECTADGWCFSQWQSYDMSINTFNQTYVIHVRRKQNQDNDLN